MTEVQEDAGEDLITRTQSSVQANRATDALEVSKKTTTSKISSKVSENQRRMSRQSINLDDNKSFQNSLAVIASKPQKFVKIETTAMDSSSNNSTTPKPIVKVPTQSVVVGRANRKSRFLKDGDKRLDMSKILGEKSKFSSQSDGSDDEDGPDFNLTLEKRENVNNSAIMNPRSGPLRLPKTIVGGGASPRSQLNASLLGSELSMNKTKSSKPREKTTVKRTHRRNGTTSNDSRVRNKLMQQLSQSELTSNHDYLSTDRDSSMEPVGKKGFVSKLGGGFKKGIKGTIGFVSNKVLLQRKNTKISDQEQMQESSSSGLSQQPSAQGKDEDKHSESGSQSDSQSSSADSDTSGDMVTKSEAANSALLIQAKKEEGLIDKMKVNRQRRQMKRKVRRALRWSKAKGLEYSQKSSEQEQIEDDMNEFERSDRRRTKLQEQSAQREQIMIQYERAKQEEIQRKKLLMRTSTIDTLHKNETEKRAISYEIDELLTFKNEFQRTQQKVIQFQDFTGIFQKLFVQRNHENYGVTTCLHLYSKFLFLGNSNGIIRVFNYKTQSEMKPLMHKSLDQIKVSTIYIDNEGQMCVSGYSNGWLAIWDLQKYQLLKVMDTAHSSEVTKALIYEMTSESIKIIAAEEDGAVVLIKVTKKPLIGGYRYTVKTLYDSCVLDVSTTIAMHTPIEQFPTEFDGRQTVAIGSANEIIITHLLPTEKEILRLNKPRFANTNNSVPYMDWGFGATPISGPGAHLLAIAWGSLIQLFYFDTETSTLIPDGFYYSDSGEISAVHFVAPSIIMVMIGAREIRILCTFKFYPDTVKYLILAQKEDLPNVQKKVKSFQKNSELEIHDIPEVKSSLIYQRIKNYNNSLSAYKQNIAFVGLRSIRRCRIFSFREYLEHLQTKEKMDWVSILKVALEIYQGKMLGFAKLPTCESVRIQTLSGMMKALIKQSVQNALMDHEEQEKDFEPFTEHQQMLRSCSRDNKESMEQFEERKTSILRMNTEIEAKLIEGQSSLEIRTIQIAMEFCIKAKICDFLFADIQKFLTMKHLLRKTVIVFQYFALAGQWKNQRIPEQVIWLLIDYYEDCGIIYQKQLVLMNIDLTAVLDQQKLEQVFQKYQMSSALIYLKTIQAKAKKQKGCISLLNTLNESINIAKKYEDEKLAEDYRYQFMNEDDIKLMSLNQDYEDELDDIINGGASTKQEVEKSTIYKVAKLLWVIRQFLDGYDYQGEQLEEENHQQHVIDISEFLQAKGVLSNLLLVPELFFSIMLKLFSGKLLQFLMSMKRNKLVEFQSPKKIIQSFYARTLIFMIVGERNYLNVFYRFILRVQAQQTNEDHDFQSKQLIEIDHQIVQKAVINEIKGGEVTNGFVQTRQRGKKLNVDECLVVRAMQAKKFSNEDIEEIFQVIETEDLKLPSIRIHLYEMQMNYKEAFVLQTLPDNIDKFFSDVLDWIQKTMKKLTSNNTKENRKIIKDLKEAIWKKLPDLLNQNPKKTIERAIQILNEFYEKERIQELIMQRFKQYPSLQYQFIKKYIEMNESTIRKTILDSELCAENNDKEAIQVRSFLELLVKLLCRNSPSEVAGIVSKDYYPVESCLEIVNDHILDVTDKEMISQLKHGQAVLQERKGEFDKAVTVYIEILGSINIGKIIFELDLLSEGNTKLVSSSLWDFHSCDDNKPMKITEKGVQKTHVFKYIKKFDSILQSACRIADLKVNNSEEVSEDAWFKILEFLEIDYIIRKEATCEKALKQDYKPRHAERLEDFAVRRRDALLKMEELQIKLDRLIKKLKLEYKQVKKLFQYKILKSRDILNIEQFDDIFVQKYHIDMLKQNAQRGIQGYHIDVNEICTLCGEKLVNVDVKEDDAEPIKVFTCGHQFHGACLHFKKCPICAQNDIMVNKKALRIMQTSRKYDVILQQQQRMADFDDENDSGDEMGGGRRQSSFNFDIGREQLLTKMTMINQERFPPDLHSERPRIPYTKLQRRMENFDADLASNFDKHIDL